MTDDDKLNRLLDLYTTAPADDMLAARLAALAQPAPLPLHGWRRAAAACFVALAGFALGALQNGGAEAQNLQAQHSYAAQALWSLGAGQPVIF